METQNTNSIDYGRIVEEIIRIMVEHGATHKDAKEIIWRFEDAIKLQKIRIGE